MITIKFKIITNNKHDAYGPHHIAHLIKHYRREFKFRQCVFTIS